MLKHSIFSAVAAGSSVSLAGFTDIGKTPVAEPTQEQVLEHLYGGDFVGNGLEYTNGTLQVSRVADFDGDTDESFSGMKFTARPVAKFSGRTQSVSLVKGGTSSTLFNVDGYGYDVNSVEGSDASFSELATFNRSGSSGTHSSVASENSDGRDHLITYKVVGLDVPEEAVLVQFWEDMNLAEGTPVNRSFADFNDLVVEVRATAVPLPAAVWAAAVTIGGASLLHKRLRRLSGL